MSGAPATPNANEFILFRAKGSCYKFVRVAKEWSKTGEGCAVMLLHDRARNLHRVVGLTEDSTVVLESTLFAGLESELRKTFLQWRDGQRIVGVKFSDESVGARFAQRLASVVSAIGSEEGAAATATSSPASSVSSVVSSPVVPAASKEGAAVSVAARKGPTVRKSGVALLTPRAQTSRQLFQRVDSMAMPESNVCCVCGTEKNDLLLKSVNSDGTVEGEVLRLTQTRADALPKRLCTACWIRNLLEQK